MPETPAFQAGSGVLQTACVRPPLGVYAADFKGVLLQSGLPSPGLLPQAIAFVRDFAAFAGIRGVVAAALAVVAASFEGAGLLLLVPLLSLITVSDTGTGWTHRRSKSPVRRRARSGCRCCSAYLLRS